MSEHFSDKNQLMRHWTITKAPSHIACYREWAFSNLNDTAAQAGA